MVINYLKSKVRNSLGSKKVQKKEQNRIEEKERFNVGDTKKTSFEHSFPTD